VQSFGAARHGSLAVLGAGHSLPCYQCLTSTQLLPCISVAAVANDINHKFVSVLRRWLAGGK
jgi:hypothetical protein